MNSPALRLTFAAAYRISLLVCQETSPIRPAHETESTMFADQQNIITIVNELHAHLFTRSGGGPDKQMAPVRAVIWSGFHFDGLVEPCPFSWQIAPAVITAPLDGHPPWGQAIRAQH